MLRLERWFVGWRIVILLGSRLGTAGARASKQVMLNMYRGMLGKFAIVIVGFILILSNVKPLSAVHCFVDLSSFRPCRVAPFWVSRLQNENETHFEIFEEGGRFCSSQDSLLLFND